MEPTKVVRYTKTETSKNTFVRPGYRFIGWKAYRESDEKWRFVNSEGSGKWEKYGDQSEDYKNFNIYEDGVVVSNNTSVDCDNITFFAVWVEYFKYTLKFDANGGEGTMEDQLCMYGESTRISKNQFTRKGYRFIGWNLYQESTDRWRYSKDGKGYWYTKDNQPSGYSLSVYSDEKSISTIGTGLDDVVRLYAVWEKLPKQGDVNGDGEVNVRDVTLLQKYIAKCADETSLYIEVCDVNNDNEINVRDVTLIQEYIVSLITSFDFI